MKSLLMILVLAVSVAGCGKKKKSSPYGAFSRSYIQAMCSGQIPYQMSTITGTLVVTYGPPPLIVLPNNDQFYLSGSPAFQFINQLYYSSPPGSPISRQVTIVGAPQCPPPGYGSGQQNISFIDVQSIQ